MKIVFFDIDGTLTDLKTHQIVPSAKIALEKLKQAGHFVCFSRRAARRTSHAEANADLAFG